MIAELIPLLETHDLHCELQVKEENLHIHLLPRVKDESVSQSDRHVLQQPLFKKYNLNTFTNQQLIDDIHGYSNTLIEGTTELSSIEENIKKRAAEKKATKKPAGKNTTKPKRKTQAQKREEAREEQAKKKAEEPGQGDLFDENSSRLDEKKEKPKAEPEPLKTAVEKAEEKTEEEDSSLADL